MVLRSVQAFKRQIGNQVPDLPDRTEVVTRANRLAERDMLRASRWVGDCSLSIILWPSGLATGFART